MRYLGCFVSCAGGLYKILDHGDALDINTVMTHPAPPQKWNSSEFKDSTAKDFLERKKKGTKVKKVFFHGIYLINLANPDKQKFHLSKVSLVNHMTLLHQIDGDGVVFHTGSMKDWKDENEGFDQVSYGINWIMGELEKKLPEIKPESFLLECAAGSGSVIGDKLEELKRIYDGVDDKYKKYVGFCLDTQHLYASGYDYAMDMDAFVKNVDDTVGMGKIKAVHFNDSKTELGSNKDRHENLGDGLIGKEKLTKFLNHTAFANIPFILETPALGEEGGSESEMKKLKEWAS